MSENSSTTDNAYQSIAHIIQEKGFATGIDIREAYIRTGCSPTTSNNFTFELSRNFRRITDMEAVLIYDGQTHIKVVFRDGLSEDQQLSIRRRAAEELQVYKQRLRREKIS